MYTPVSGGSTASAPLQARGYKYALLLGRSHYDPNSDSLDSLCGVAPTMRNMAVDLVANGFKVFVVADTPVALAQPASTDAREELHYTASVNTALQNGDLSWHEGDATRESVRHAVDGLAHSVAGHDPSPTDELYVHIASHGVSNASTGETGAALASLRRISRPHTDSSGVEVAACFEGAYTMGQLHEDLEVDFKQRWRNTLVVLDMCHSGGVFDTGQPQTVCRCLRGRGDSAVLQTMYLSESFQCLAAAPSETRAFCLPTGTLLHRELRRAWLSPGHDSGIFSLGSDGIAQWATIGAAVHHVNVELALVLSSYVVTVADHYELRQTCVLGRLPWRIETNLGEFVLFNRAFVETRVAGLGERDLLRISEHLVEGVTSVIATADFEDRLATEYQDWHGQSTAVWAEMEGQGVFQNSTNRAASCLALAQWIQANAAQRQYTELRLKVDSMRIKGRRVLQLWRRAASLPELPQFLVTHGIAEMCNVALATLPLDAINYVHQNPETLHALPVTSWALVLLINACAVDTHTSAILYAYDPNVPLLRTAYPERDMRALQNAVLVELPTNSADHVPEPLRPHVRDVRRRILQTLPLAM